MSDLQPHLEWLNENADAIKERALEMWRAREMTFPPRVRRMNPDDMDMATGTWAYVLNQAVHELKANQS